MAGKPQAEIEDEICLRIEDYEWALRKHGVEPLIGHIESVIDPKFLAPVAWVGGMFTLFGQPVWGTVGAGSLGRVCVKPASCLLARQDFERRINPEISYVYELKQLSQQ